MSRRTFLPALCLGASALAASGLIHADSNDRPPVLEKLAAHGVTIMDAFDAGDGLQGFAGVTNQQPVAVYVTSGGDAIVGTRIDADGNARDAKRLQELVTRPLGEQTWAKLESAHWVRDGDINAPRVVYTFSDPNCPYCNRLWQAARPWVESGKVQLRHVMVGVIRQDSAAKAATILGAKDPGAKLVENESRFAEGGVAAASSVSAQIRQRLDANQRLMTELGFRGTPALMFRDQEGIVQRRSGMPQGADLDAVMGPGQ